jgi:hypothetical protein
METFSHPVSSSCGLVRDFCAFNAGFLMDVAFKRRHDRSGTTFDVMLLLTRHADINYLVIVMAPRDTTSADFSTFFQPLLRSLSLANRIPFP